MGAPIFNNAPTPVLNSITVPRPDSDKCDQLKARLGLSDTGDPPTLAQYGGTERAKDTELHHILQDKAMTGLISKYSGFCIALSALSGEAHDVVNQKQIDRNCPGGGVEKAGSKTFGELQKDSVKDLKAGLKAKAKEDGKKLSDKEADTLARCLVVEAVVKTQEYRKKKKKPYLTENSKVKGVKGCFALGTAIWIATDRRIAVEEIVPGQMLQTAQGPCEVVRVDRCLAELVTISLAEGDVALAGEHRVRLSSGRSVRADDLRTGAVVQTARGPRRVERVRASHRLDAVLNFGIGRADVCRVGPSGLVVDLRDLGWPMASAIAIQRVAAQETECPH